jgi:hypothetical protein
MRYRLCASLLLLTLGQLGGAASPQIKITGIYSDLHYIEESGDFIGMELLVLPGDGDPVHCPAFFQLAEGQRPTAVVVDLQVVADHFEFRVPANGDSPEMRFSVRFTAHEAVVSNTVAGTEEHLRRGRSYWE